MSTKSIVTATKPQKYGTRRLLAGDTFEVRTKDVKLLVALKRVTEGRPDAAIPAIPATLAAKVKPHESLYGSSVMQSHYDIGGQQVQLGTIVAGAHKLSGLSVDAWNLLPSGERDNLLSDELKRLQDAAAPATDETEQKQEEQQQGNAVGAMTTATAEGEQTDDIQAARAEYKEVVGRAAYGGWDVAKIRENIEAFKAKK